MGKLNYTIGDATIPQGNGLKIIPHVCNNIGAWGAGFVLALSKKWLEPENHYRTLPEYKLGDVFFIKVEDDTYVANMIAQEGVAKDVNGIPPVRYAALKKALKRLSLVAEENHATVHMPRIASGLAGGDWNTIEILIEENVHVPVTVYDLPVK